MTLAHEQLHVWQQAMGLARAIYKITASFPGHEQFGLTSQLRRAAVSIPANIAEGKGRYHKKEFVQFLYNARGSLYETLTLLTLATDLRYLASQDHQQLVTSAKVILSQLSGLINSLK
ncbi:MAG: four helix bundle protein [Candidatus Omnitrophica bacterium]|nr:four helix bundle protein [Candidatus Omnitrophota bacterium]